MAKKKFYNLFPVPIFQHKIENYQEINQELLNYILELQKKNKIGNTHSRSEERRVEKEYRSRWSPYH